MISVGSYVMIQKLGGEHVRVCRVKKGNKILIEKLTFKIDGAIGHPYGLFEACAEKVTPVPPGSPTTIVIENECINIPVVETKEADTLDENDVNGDSQPRKRQKLTHEDIGALKRAGVSTGKIITQLVNGNALFRNRTEYSQLKYREKKTKKHSDRVLILKPTIRLLVNSYYKRDPERIAHLRMDFLGQILQLSGVRTGSRVFVYEQALGLVGAAIVERLAGEGTCVFLHRYEVPQSIPGVFAMEFSDTQLNTFCPLRLTTFLSEFRRTPTIAGSLNSENRSASTTTVSTLTALSSTENAESHLSSVIIGIEQNGFQKDEPVAVPEQVIDASESKIKSDDVVAIDDDQSNFGEGEEIVSTVGSVDVSTVERRRVRAERERTALALLKPGVGGFDDVGALDAIVIVVNSTDAEDLIERVYASLRLSGTIVVYSSVESQIVAIYNWLRKHGAVDVQMSDQFFRHHQVLPDRTRPLMRQIISGGFILSAVKVKT